MASSNRYRTPNEQIRPGYSPSDLVVEIKRIKLDGGTVDVTPDAKNGTFLGYNVYKTATVTDGVVTIDPAVASGTDEVIVEMIYKAQNLQDGANAFA